MKFLKEPKAGNLDNRFLISLGVVTGILAQNERNIAGPYCMLRVKEIHFR